MRKPVHQLSPWLVISWFMMLNVSVTLCTLRISYWAVIAWQTAITHQNLLSRGNNKNKGTKQWACKPNKTGEQEM